MKRDLEEYLISLQKQRDEMLKAVNEANELILKGKISDEQRNSIQSYFNQLESNYQRVLYCRYLYNLPPKLIRKFNQKKMEKEAKRFLEQQADRESIEKENQECIEKVKENSNG